MIWPVEPRPATNEMGRKLPRPLDRYRASGAHHAAPVHLGERQSGRAVLGPGHGHRQQCLLGEHGSVKTSIPPARQLLARLLAAREVLCGPAKRVSGTRSPDTEPARALRPRWGPAISARAESSSDGGPSGRTAPWDGPGAGRANGRCRGWWVALLAGPPGATGGYLRTTAPADPYASPSCARLAHRAQWHHSACALYSLPISGAPALEAAGRRWPGHLRRAACSSCDLCGDLSPGLSPAARHC